MSSEVTTRDVRLRAAELARERWEPTPIDVWYGLRPGLHSAYDMSSLLRRAARELDRANARQLAFRACYALAYEVNDPGLFWWENAPIRTVDDVVRALRGEWPAELRTRPEQRGRLAR